MEGFLEQIVGLHGWNTYLGVGRKSRRGPDWKDAGSRKRQELLGRHRIVHARFTPGFPGFIIIW